MQTVDVVINRSSEYTLLHQNKHTRRTERNPRLRETSEFARMCFNLDGQYRAGTLNTGSTTNGTERKINMC